MFSKRYEFSTKMKKDDIINKLNSITIGRHFYYKKKIQPNYIGDFDNTGFKFRRGYNIIGNFFFRANYFEQDSITNVSASIKTSAGTSVFYFFLDALILLSLLNNYQGLDLVKLATIFLLLSVPVLIVYLSFRYDKREAEKFLKYIFDYREILIDKDKNKDL